MIINCGGGVEALKKSFFNIIIASILNHILTFVLPGTSRAPSPTGIILSVHIGFIGLYNLVHQG